MQVRLRSNGNIMTFDPGLRVGKGGEGVVYAVPAEPSLVAKIYHQSKATLERGRKLEAMLGNPPADPMQAKGHVSIAWPVDLLELPRTGQVIGFLMPRMGLNMHPIVDFYDPKARLLSHPAFTYFHLIRAARNFISAVSALHAKRYVIGDINESNIMVDGQTALATIVDTDSFQVAGVNNRQIFRCSVGKEDFTPPELQGKDFSQMDRKREHDLFGVAVIIFQLLMEGSPPFAGVFNGAGDPPEYKSRIAKGYFPYSRKKQVPFNPGPLAPPFNVLTPKLQQLFLRCFEDGHHNSQARPDAETWRQALKEAENSLVFCKVNSQHYYGNHLPDCSWCERARRLPDPFPSKNQTRRVQQTIRQGARKPAQTAQPGVRTVPRPAVPRQAAVTPPAIHSFNAAGTSISKGQHCVLSWSVANASRIVLNNGIGVVASTGTLSIAPSRSATYILTAIGAGGTVTRAVRIRVNKPSPIIAFSASGRSVRIGQPVTLRWNIAPSHTAHLNGGIGHVANSGQVSVTPLKNRTYILTAKGAGRTVRQKIHVAVSLPPLPAPLNTYLPLSTLRIGLNRYTGLSVPIIGLQPAVSLGQYGGLQSYGNLGSVTLALQNYQPMQNYVPMRQSPLRAAKQTGALGSLTRWVKNLFGEGRTAVVGKQFD
jgi:serine/threonine protein kinase